MPAPSAPSPRLPRWLTAVVVAAAVLPVAPTLGGGFLADDFAYIARFYHLAWSEWPRLFTKEWSGGIWGDPLRELRPFTALSFMSDARLFGADALGYRITNLALHGLCAVLVLRLAWAYAIRAFDRPAGGDVGARQPVAIAAALVAGLVFALHPAHAEAIVWITGRVDLQATAAALLFWIAAEAFSAFGRGTRAGVAVGAFFLGIFSKEFCMFAPVLLLLRWLLLDLRAPAVVWRRRLVLLGGIVAVFAVYAACRRAAFGHDSIGYNLWTDEPAWQRQTQYAGWLLPVLPFHPRGEWQSFPSLGALHATWLALALTMTGALAVALRRRAWLGATTLFFLGVWYLITVFPLTGVVYFSPRHLYFPSVGLALGAGLAIATVRWRAWAGGLVVAAFAAGWWPAVQPWRRAAAVSADALAAVNAQLTAPSPQVLLISSVPETMGRTLLWAWSSPECFNAPFVAHPPGHVIERQANATRSNRWLEERRPLETIQAARDVVVLVVDASGRVTCRRLDAAQFLPHAQAFAGKFAAGGLSPEAWSDWVQTVARP